MTDQIRGTGARSDRIDTGSPVTIAKIGGSLLGTPDLDAWLSVLVGSAAPVVIVPGGGAFADQVRRAQGLYGFDDRAAHHMALLAMAQVAVLLASRRAALDLVSDPAEIEAAAARGRTSVWLPAAMALAARDVPASWDVTSDSLAAWLAGRLGAARVLLVKSCDVPAPVTARELADRGIVDRLFPRFAATSAAAVFVAGPAWLAAAGPLLQAGDMPGVPVHL